MGGLGKTTLAQLVYNDETVEKHFELRLWVHVSYDFNVYGLTRAIIESIDSHVYEPINLDNLQKHLKKKLAGKRYLLVLDDVWNEETEQWERLRVPLLCGARGSKILVTTRSEEVANIMSTSSPYSLGGLLDDDCWSLFCQYAFSRDPDAFSDLDDIGRQIVNKCKGLPLAAIALGHRLRRVADRSKWEAILQDESWEFSGGDGDISRAVSLSYQQLPAHLKPCFAYCSLIPKGYEFEKEFIVQLWIAQNFIQPGGGERIEDIGSYYFDSLVQKSFFQISHFDYKRSQPRYKMHDLIHDYAQHVSMEECRIVELGKPCNLSAKTRHLSLICDQFVQDNPTQSPLSNRRKNIFKTFYAYGGLYTFLLAGGSTTYEIRVPNNLAERLGSLRTLDLSNCGISMLPESIGDLKHLRCLQLPNTTIRRLPESVGCLYNLQILGLRNCDIQELPWNTRSLQRLHHLDLHLDEISVMAQGAKSRGHSLRSMPPEIGLLTDLQTLSRFVVGTKHRCGLRELKELNNLHGELQISNLHFVSKAAEASEANLSRKQYIHRLELQWSHHHKFASSRHVQELEEKVLANLQPHTNLKELIVVGYEGATFPSWIGHSSFSKLVALSLSNCKKCEILPPLGQLPALKDLYIKEIDGVKIVDCSFCGHDARNFPSLQKLHFESMHSLQVWCGKDNCLLPSLRELVFKNCSGLRQLTHNLPSLTKLEIEGSPKLVGLRSFPSLQSLEVKASGEWVFDSWSSLTSLSSLTLSRLPTISLPSKLQLGHASIRCLEISHCDHLISLPDNWLPSGLTYFAIKHCSQLRALPRGLQNLRKLEDLEIQSCGHLEYLPDGLKNLTSLMRFEISDCPQLLCLPNDGLPTKLTVLEHQQLSRAQATV
ncbi:putative disease resistance protein RGA3 [Phoenix dactylifera]|uniref:Disease resistance protein RGA3 n=1 Tax=Phoenix dactylifera TaxID=42345 RepID=A0A8B8ZQA6_PHODC|nr:putative disease resistance protein RGA3 [Phoenix dactylifera]